MMNSNISKRSLRLAALLSSAWLVVGPNASAAFVDLTASGSASGNIGDVIFTRDNLQTAGTGVFDPFLTIQSPGNQLTEQGYNTSGRPLPLDDLRNHWNTDLQFGDLLPVQLNGADYFSFHLDANEPGQGNDARFLSIDNIRIYTSATGGLRENNPNNLGTLRYAMNDLGGPYDNWVKIDSSRNTPLQVTSGSGSADMFVYIPTHYFNGVLPSDFIYFYNMNGAHFSAEGELGAQAGFEEWRAQVVPEPTTMIAGSLLLIPFGISTLRLLRRNKSA